MRLKYIITILIITMLSCTNNNKEKEAILNVMKQQEKDWNNGNIESFMKGYWQSDSLMFIGKNGINYGWQNVLTNYKKSYPNKNTMGVLKFSILHLDINDNSAFMIGKWNIVRKEGNPNGHFSLFWKKLDNKWLIVADHTS